MKTRLILFYLFNIIDIVSTLYIIGNGGVELNPLCAWLLQWPLVFVLVKLGAAALAVYPMWQLREHRLARIASWIAFIEYAYIAIYYACMFLFFI